MTLKEYCEWLGAMGKTDQEIIYDYIRDNHLEAWAITAMAKLSEDRVNDLNWKSRYAETWATSLLDRHLIEDYGWGDGRMLYNFALFVVMHSRPPKWGETFAVLDENVEVPPLMLEELKERIPQLEMPFVYLRPAIESLHNLGIYFKDEEKENGNDRPTTNKTA